MLNTYQIKEIIKDNNLFINKRFGQNFLIDRNVIENIVSSCEIKRDDMILEIGPGLGALTESLLMLCAHLIAIEKDRGFAKFLKETFIETGNIDIINDDILKYEIPALYKKYKKKIKVIGNLPYYISTPVIFWLLENKEYIDSIYITIQKEVARRVIAKPKSEDYGLLSCGVQYHCKPEIMMQIKKTCFFPQPQVDSSFLKLSILKEPAVKVKNEKLFFAVMQAAFNYRRKTLFNALMQSEHLRIDKPALTSAFDALGIDHKIRGEELGLEDFARISQTFAYLTDVWIFNRQAVPGLSTQVYPDNKYR